MQPGPVTRRSLAVYAAGAGAAVVLSGLLAGCGSSATKAVAPRSPRPPKILTGSPVPAGVGVSFPPKNSCQAGHEQGYELPDPQCTPGAVDPVVSSANIGTTICTQGWALKQEVAKGLREPEKVTALAAYGDPDRPDAYQLDRVIPIELGGAKNSAKNMWPEPGGTNTKDQLESTLHDLVCSHKLALATAQHAIASDWVKAFQKYVGLLPPAPTIK